VPSRRAFQRLELSLGALGLTAALVVLVVAVDALQFHTASLWSCACHLQLNGVEPQSAALMLLGLLDAVVIFRAVRSLVRQLRAQHAFRRRLPVLRVVDVDGHRVRVVPGEPLHAFCAGLLRPAVYLSEGALTGTGGPELRAILAHEAHHRARRDPLRMLVARVLSDAFRPAPLLSTLADRHVALADLAADAAAVRALGDAQPLAAALVRFDDTAARTGGGVAPERVDQLVRQTPPDSVSPRLLAAAGLALAGLIAFSAPMLILGWHPEPAVPLTLELAAVALASVPACLAARRAGTCVSPRPE